MSIDTHPLCEILPPMPTGEYRMLVEDIKAKGLVRPITLFEDKILDGRHRFQACKDAGVPARFEPYEGNDPAGFVASSCIHRSLTTSQRALIAAGFLAYEKQQARARQLSGRNLPETFPEGRPGEARDKAGERMHVSGRTVDYAVNVLAYSPPEVVESIRRGESTVSAAARALNRPTRSPVSGPVRAEQVRALATGGHRREQIAANLGITEQMVAKVAKENGIDVPLAGSKMHKIKPAEVLERVVMGLEATASSLRTLPLILDGILPATAKEWDESITASIKQITYFRNQLRNHHG